MLPEPDKPYTEAEAEMEKNCVLFPDWYVEEVITDGYAGVFLPQENWEIYLRLYDQKKTRAPYSTRDEEKKTEIFRRSNHRYYLKNREKIIEYQRSKARGKAGTQLK